MYKAGTGLIISRGSVHSKQFTIVEGVAKIAVVFAAFPINALTGQSMIISNGGFMRKAKGSSNNKLSDVVRNVNFGSRSCQFPSS